MVGDLGNIVADESGTAMVDITDRHVQLLGPHSVLGRITAGADDMGRGGHENSLVTGNTGPRVAAGIIGLAL
jgi:superoxide dismutase, Cu-Zn family